MGLLAIVFFALAIRIAVAFHVDTSAFMAVDGREYLDIAENLAMGRGFAVSHYRWFESVPPNAPATHPDMYRPPLLPLVGAGLVALPGDWMVWARISMVVLGLAVVAFVYSLGKALFGISAGLLAAILIAMDPFAAHYAATWSTETPFALCLLAAVTFLAWARQSGRSIHYAAAGVSLGLASLARPTGLVIGGGLLVWLSRSPQRGGRVPAFLNVLLPMMVVVAPWAARNASITGAPNPGTFFGPYNLWLGNNHRMYALYSAGESTAFAPLLDSLYSEDSDEHVRALQSAGIFDVTASNSYWLREARRYLADNPKESASIVLHRCIHFVRPWPNRATTGPLDFWASLLWIGPLMGLAILSLARRPSTRDPVLLLPILLGFLVSLPFIFHLRFRFPVFDCYLAVISAPAILDVAHSLRVGRLFDRRDPGRPQSEPDVSHPDKAPEQATSTPGRSHDVA